MRTNQVLDPATLASPDLLSDMSDVKMSTILSAEQMEQTPYEERAEAIALQNNESFGFLEQFNDRLEREKVHKSLRSKRDLQPGDKEQTKIIGIQHASILEPQLQEIYTGVKTSSRSSEVKDMTGMISHLSVDMDQYLEQRADVMPDSQEDLVQDRFEQVITKRDGKRRPPDIKKPIRKKLRDRQRSGCSSSEGELERVSSEESLDGDVVLNENAPAATIVMGPPASPLVVETPLGSIKDRVRALEDKVEEEAEQKYPQKIIPPAKSSIVSKKTEADMPELPRLPISPKSPQSQTERLEETMSVRDLLKAFQTGQDPSKNKTGLFEHKPLASALTSESRYADIEQEQKSQTQTHDVTDFQQRHDEKPVGQKLDSEESLLSPDRNVVKVADCENVSSQEGAPELSEKETLSVKERAKSFQVVQDPKPEIFDHKPLVGYTESIQITDRHSSEEPESQPQNPDISITDIKSYEKTDGDQMPSLTGEHSEDSRVEKTVRFTDIVISDDGSISVAPDLKEETLSVKELMKAFQSDQDPLKGKLKPSEHTTSKETIETLDIIQFHNENVQIKEPELLGGNLSRMRLEEPTLSMGPGLPDDMQISPDRRPSEDFSADIKAELEESPEYQLFKQTSTASDVSYQLMGEGDSLHTQIKDNDQSPGSPEQYGLAEPSNFIDKGESEISEGPQTATQIITFSSTRKRGNLDDRIKEHTTVTQKITELKLQEVYVQRETPIRETSGVKDMSGMLSLLSTDMDQCMQALSVMSSTPEEEVIHETFEQIVIKKSKDKEKVAMSPDKGEAPAEEQSNRWSGEEVESEEFSTQEGSVDGKTSYQLTTKVKDASGMISLLTADLENDKDRPASISFPEEDVIQEDFEQISPINPPQTVIEEQRTVWESTQARSEGTTEEIDLAEILLTSEPETAFQKGCISQKTQHHVASAEKNMSGMLSILSNNLDEYLNENPVRKQSPLEDSFLCKEDTVTGISEDGMSVEEDKQMLTELSPSPVAETPFQEYRTTRKPQQPQSVITGDMSGMFSLLTSDLDEYLREHPLVIPNNQEEQAVCETCEEVILRKELPKKETLSPEQHATSLEDINLDTETVKMRALDSGMQARSTEAASLKGFSSEEGEVETTIHIKKSYLSVGDQENDGKDEEGFANSVLEKHTFLQQLSSSEAPQRPVELEKLNIAVPDDPAKEPCHPDSLEASPQVEDRSSRTTPDSIEPGPGRDSPCPDSLEGSPTQTDLQMPARAAVYEDYASQLEACFAYDKDIYRDESEEEEQEENILHIESEIKQDMHLESSKGENADVVFSDHHLLMRQDSQDRDDEEENDISDKQLTPEEKMFKMAAKIKTFEEMEQEEKVKPDNTKPLETDSDDHDEAVQDRHAGKSVMELNNTLNSEANLNLIIQRDEIQSERKTAQVDGSLSLSGTPRAEVDFKTEETAALSDSVSKSEQESHTLVTVGKKDDAFTVEMEAAGQIGVEEERKTPLVLPGEKTPDPFQFQEGKLFEMTRGGAIDMTRRSFEGNECAFFPIGEPPVDEDMSEETGENQKRSHSVTDSNLEITSPTSEDDKIPSSVNTMFVKPRDSSETPLSAADLGSSTEVQLGSPDGSREHLSLDYFQSTIADLQSDPSIIVHFSGSMQRQSPDLSNDEGEQEDEEDQSSVIERSSAAQPDLHESSKIKTANRTEEATVKELQVYEVKSKVEAKSPVDRRSRSEADSATSKTSLMESRSYSDSSEPADNLSKIKPQAPPTLGERNDIQLSNREASVRSSLDAGDMSSSSHRSPDSVIFTYDILPSHSSVSDYDSLLVVKPSSGTEDVFQSQPIQDDMVITQNQTIIDDQTSQYPSGMARLFALPRPLLSLSFFFPLTVRLQSIFLQI